MNDYLFIDTNGKQQTVTAGSSSDALRLAPNIAKNSGVQLVTKTTPAVPDPVPATSLKPVATPALPTPTADTVQGEYVTSVTQNVDTQRTALDKTLANQKAEADRKAALLDKEQTQILDQSKPLTDPFRQKLETSERDRLHINENFEANQKLTNELDTLMTEGNNLIKYNQGLPVSQRISTARADKAISDVAARAGVIQAVMSARNNQIGVAETMIDRSVAAITADRADKLAYYDTLLKLNDEKKLDLSNESKQIAQQQVDLMKGDLDRTEKTADYIKELMISPDHAQLLADAGVTLNDSVEEINKKLSVATKRQAVVDFTNEMKQDGYKAAVAGTPGAQEFEVGGEKVYLTPPPPKTTGSAGDGIVVRSGALTYTRQDYAEDANALEQSRGDDGWVDPGVYQQLYEAWVGNGGVITDFISKFPPKSYVNPANTTLPPALRNTTGANAADARIEALING